MWRSVIAFVLLPSLTLAQTIAGIYPQTADIASTQTPPYYRAYTNYERIRPGSEERAAFSFTLNPGTFMSHKSKGEDIVPMRLELNDDPGFSIRDIDYPMGYNRSFQFRRGTLNVLGPANSIQFQLKAGKDATPGKHVLHGRLIFQQVGDSGFTPADQIEIELTVEVALQGETSVASDWPFSPAKKPASENREKWTLVALAPLLIPLLFIQSIVCMISGEDCTC